MDIEFPRSRPIWAVEVAQWLPFKGLRSDPMPGTESGREQPISEAGLILTLP